MAVTIKRRSLASLVGLTPTIPVGAKVQLIALPFQDDTSSLVGQFATVEAVVHLYPEKGIDGDIFFVKSESGVKLCLTWKYLKTI